jgi:uncharacterized membrane protein
LYGLAIRMAKASEHRTKYIPWDIPWLPALAAVVAAVLYARLPDKFIFGPHQTIAALFRWLVPGLVVVLLSALILIHRHELEIHQEVRTQLRRRMAIALIAIINAANMLSVVLLVRFIINGGKAGGHQLVISAIDIWWTNIIVFSLWFWELDRGGPAARAENQEQEPDFLFPQMATPELFPKPLKPAFIDYFYVAFTNAAAFSPTDTMPLTPQAKMLMLIESAVSLLTLLMVASRAVNIL